MPDSNNFWFLNDNDNSPIYKTASTKDLFYDEDRCAETFYQYQAGFCDGLINSIHH